jgi:hypothetical protein
VLIFTLKPFDLLLATFPLALPVEFAGGTGVVALNDFLITFFSLATGVCFTVAANEVVAAGTLLGRVAGTGILFFGDLLLAAAPLNEGMEEDDEVTILDTFLGIVLTAAATTVVSLLVIIVGDFTGFAAGTGLSGLGLDATFLGTVVVVATAGAEAAAAVGTALAILSIDGCKVRLVAGGKSRMILSILAYLIVPFFTNETRHNSPC